MNFENKNQITMVKYAYTGIYFYNFKKRFLKKGSIHCLQHGRFFSILSTRRMEKHIRYRQASGILV